MTLEIDIWKSLMHHVLFCFQIVRHLLLQPNLNSLHAVFVIWLPTSFILTAFQAFFPGMSGEFLQNNCSNGWCSTRLPITAPPCRWVLQEVPKHSFSHSSPACRDSVQQPRAKECLISLQPSGDAPGSASSRTQSCADRGELLLLRYQVSACGRITVLEFPAASASETPCASSKCCFSFPEQDSLPMQVFVKGQGLLSPPALLSPVVQSSSASCKTSNCST